LLHRRPFAESLVALAFAMLTSNASSGQTPAASPPTEAELNQARARFAAARALEDGGRWAEALTLFQRVAEVKMTPQVRFHIGLCLENVGLWTQALDVYTQAVSEAGEGAPEVVTEANEHLGKLQASIPTISVCVAGAEPGDALLLDHRPLPLDEPALPIRADPGPHTAEVWRGGALMAREFFALQPLATPTRRRPCNARSGGRRSEGAWRRPPSWASSSACGRTR
jgi:tetratricopeptide (TPR) repeat protein